MLVFQSPEEKRIENRSNQIPTHLNGFKTGSVGKYGVQGGVSCCRERKSRRRRD